MRTATKGKLIGLAVIEAVLGILYLFDALNPAVFAVVTIGIPIALLFVIAPVVFCAGQTVFPFKLVAMIERTATAFCYLRQSN